MRPSLTILIPILAVCSVCPIPAQEVLVTEAGAGPTGLPGPAANLAYPGAIHRSPTGELLVMTDRRLVQIDASGIVRVIAGEGVNCDAQPYGDGGPAWAACLTSVAGVTRESGKGLVRDAAGWIYFSDTGHHAIRRIDPQTGIISRWAGIYLGVYSGDGGAASSAGLHRPHQIVFDAAGNMFIADRGNHRIRKVSAATGVITTVAGTGTATGSIDGEIGNPLDNLGDGLPATEASLNLPWGVAVDAAGNLYIGDTGNHRVRKVSAATGRIATIAGNGVFGFDGQEEVPATTSSMAGPNALSLDGQGNLIIADSHFDLYDLPPEEEHVYHRVRRLNLGTGIIATVPDTVGLGASHAIADAAGNIYIADHWLNKIWRNTDTLAGNGTLSFAGDGHPARYARFNGPGALAFDAAGHLYVADQHNHRVRRVHADTGVVTTVAGNGSDRTAGDNGQAASGSLRWPADLAIDASGNLYIADYAANRVRKVTAATGVITTVAGNGTPGFGGDGGQAKLALLAAPTGVAVNGAGDLFIADSDNNRVRKVSAATGIISTVAGTGWGYHELDGPGGSTLDETNDGGPATSASVSYPRDVLLDSSGNLLISDAYSRLRRVTPGGTISTIAGDGSGGVAGDGGPATEARVSPDQLALDATGNIFLTQSRRVRRIDRTTGIITTVLGNDLNQFFPDGSDAATASLVVPLGVAVNGAGRVFYSESATFRIRSTAPSPGASLVPAGNPFTVTRASNGDLTLSWGSSCLATDHDYGIYEGTLGTFDSHVPRFCSTGGATGRSFTPAAGNTYYLVVPRNALEEGSYGVLSNGAERPASATACLPQHIASMCQ
jgi:sugar lactone lactonase YvrE